jgi:hypothetical protein
MLQRRGGIPDHPAFRSNEESPETLQMAKLPDNRRPFDPAKAARDRNAAAEAAKSTPLTLEQRTVRKHGLRPVMHGLRDKD